jgi:hypothetical protein
MVAVMDTIRISMSKEIGLFLSYTSCGFEDVGNENSQISSVLNLVSDNPWNRSRVMQE